MKNKIMSYFFFFFIIICFGSSSHSALIIWQVGALDDSYEGFVLPEKDVIDYLVPINWATLLGQEEPDWGQFPAFFGIYGDRENTLRELRINFYYPREYTHSTLIIRAACVSHDPEKVFYVELFKGDTFIAKKQIEMNRFYPYDFSLGFIKKGFHDENMIVIRSSRNTESSIILDTIYLQLDDTDSDGDGVMDVFEGDFFLDEAHACIPIMSYDPAITKKISLHIDKPEESSTCFRQVRSIGEVSLNIPEWMRTQRYQPFGFFGFKVEKVEPDEQVHIHISYNDPLYPSARFYAHQPSNIWQELDYELLDGNTAAVTLLDGGLGDSEGWEDGIINTVLTLSYPRELNEHIEKVGCFIEASDGAQ